MKNYYDILEVGQKASFKEIRAEFRRLSKKYHPDTNQEIGSDDIFNNLQEAYNVLKDGIKREEYDEKLQLSGYKPNVFTNFKYAFKNKIRRKEQEVFWDDGEEVDFRPTIRNKRLPYQIAAGVISLILVLGMIVYLEHKYSNYENEAQAWEYNTSEDEKPAQEKSIKSTKSLYDTFVKKFTGLNSKTEFRKTEKKELKKIPATKFKSKTPALKPAELKAPASVVEEIKKEAPPVEPVIKQESVAPVKTSESPQPINASKIYSDREVETRPKFAGGSSAFVKYLSSNLNYPREAQEDGISGRVMLTFIIEPDGKLSDIKVAQGIGSGCDEEALRVMQQAPPWIPGEINGEKVRVKATIPITFVLR